MRLRFIAVVLVLAWVTLLASAQERSYTVQRGDTLTSIAQQFNISAQVLAQRNALTWAGGLQAGQTLVIPAANFVATSHTVQRGDTLTNIAALYGTTVSALEALNNISNGAIQAGQVLVLSGASVGQGGGFVAPSAGVTTSAGGVPVVIVQPTPAPITSVNPSLGQGGPVATTPIGPVVHIVDIGETLQTIAARYGTTWDVLAQANNLTNPNFLPAGTSLVIPVGGTGGPSTGQGGGVTPTTPITAVYVVRVGDTLSQIAERFNTTVSAVRSANGLNSSLIFVGQSLLIPYGGGNLGSGGGTVGTGGPSTRPLYPFANGSIRGNRYVIASGDTLFGIGARFNVDVWTIARRNHILNLNHIFAGTVLIIPGR